MQCPIASSDEMKAKEAFQPFTEKLTARAGSMRALQYTAGGPEMVPCARPPDTSSLRLALTFHGSLPQLTPKLDKVTPCDNQSDVVVIGQNYQQTGREVARAMTPKALPTSQLDPIPLPFMDSNMRAVAKMIAAFSHLEYTVEPITKDEKQDSLTEVTINKTDRHMFFNHVPRSADGKLPHWEEFSKVVCSKASCRKDVYVEQFTLLVNGVVYATLDISLGSCCPKKGCLMCVECATSACKLERPTCPVCNNAVPLQERRYTLKMAEEMAQSMLSFVEEGDAAADGAAPMGGNLNAAAGSKRDRAPAAEKEMEMEKDDLEGDMDFINDMQQETAYDTFFTYPDILTAPLTFSLWEHEVKFYEAM